MTALLSYIVLVILTIMLLELLRPTIHKFALRWNYRHSAQWRKEIEEDILKRLYHRERDKQRTDLHDITQELYIRHRLLGHIHLDTILLTEVITAMRQQGLIQPVHLILSIKGQEIALSIIRRHRLYEKYLAEHSGYTADQWHKRAERMEHKLNHKEERHLARLLGHPVFDPHGDPIPTEKGEIYGYIGCSLLALDEYPERVRIIHIEDEPAKVYRDIAHRGLYLGAVIDIMGITSNGLVTYILDGQHGQLDSILAANITIKIEDLNVTNPTDGTSALSSLTLGHTAIVQGISPICRGAARRRLLDLGFVNGSRVSIDLESPLGNPTAYLVRGTTIALRKDQAQYIRVKQESNRKD